jgi:hypothetical protein
MTLISVLRAPTDSPLASVLFSLLHGLLLFWRRKQKIAPNRWYGLYGITSKNITSQNILFQIVAVYWDNYAKQKYSPFGKMLCNTVLQHAKHAVSTMLWRVCSAIYSRALCTFVCSFAVTVLNDQFQAKAVESFRTLQYELWTLSMLVKHLHWR